MNIKNKMIAKEIRMTGRVIRTVLPCFKENTFKNLGNKMGIMKGRHPKGLKYEQIYIDRPEGSSVSGKLRLCIYRPLEQKEKAPGILWMHGGGFGLGAPEQDGGFIKKFVTDHGCTVISPDYTLSIHSPYPAAIDDCYSSLLWMKEHAKELMIKEDQIMVGGDSAGGGLTAALAILARDKGEINIAYQMPLYPMIDDRMITKSSQNNDAPVWNTKSNEAAWKLYLGDLYTTDDVPVYAAPARLKDFSNLPPVFTYVGDIEPFYDETLNYMEKLKEAGVSVKYHVFEGCFHGFDIVAGKSKQARKARELLMDNFVYAKEHYFAPQK